MAGADDEPDQRPLKEGLLDTRRPVAMDTLEISEGGHTPAVTSEDVLNIKPVVMDRRVSSVHAGAAWRSDVP